MTSALAYRPRRLPLQLASPAAAVVYLGAYAVAAFLFSDPVLLTAIAAAAGLAGALAGVGAAVRFASRIGIVLALLLIVVNGVAVSRGATVLMRLGEWPLLGRVDVTLEALAAGAVIGLRALAVMIAASVYSAAVDPDRVLRALRPWLGRSALTAGLATRLLPVALADAARLREAARLRGPGAAPVGRAPLARRLMAGSLDRSVDVAATLELRGYGLASSRRGPRLTPGRIRASAAGSQPRPRQDRRFFVVGALVAAGSLAAALAGVGGFSAYPTVALDPGPFGWALALGLVLSGLAPIRSGAPRRPVRRRPSRRGGAR